MEKWKSNDSALICRQYIYLDEKNEKNARRIKIMFQLDFYDIGREKANFTENTTGLILLH
jgi:hypothetical protein